MIDYAELDVQHFNPRPSYEERQDHRFYTHYLTRDFNPRPSYEERPRERVGAQVCTTDFNPRPSYEERLALPLVTGRRTIFQSTPLIRGATSCAVVVASTVKAFQSTPLIRGATSTP